MSSPVVFGIVSPKDTSVTLNGSPQLACPANVNRTHIEFQAPVGGVWYSWVNPLCAPGLTGCFQLAPGVTYKPSGGVPSNALYVNGTTGQLMPLTEC